MYNQWTILAITRHRVDLYSYSIVPRSTINLHCKLQVRYVNSPGDRFVCRGWEVTQTYHHQHYKGNSGCYPGEEKVEGDGLEDPPQNTSSTRSFIDKLVYHKENNNVATHTRQRKRHDEPQRLFCWIWKHAVQCNHVQRTEHHPSNEQWCRVPCANVTVLWNKRLGEKEQITPCSIGIGVVVVLKSCTVSRRLESSLTHPHYRS